MDTPNTVLSALKPEANISVSVQFNYSMNLSSNHADQAAQHYLAFGMHRSTTEYPNSDGSSHSVTLGATGTVVFDDVYSPNTGSFTVVDKIISCKVENCTSDSRFAWIVYTKTKNGTAYSNEWVYIDNIKVTIVHEN